MVDLRGSGTDPSPGCFAHSIPGQPANFWERLDTHASAVGFSAGRLAEAFGWRAVAHAAGLLHDIGKCSAVFQAYIRAPEGGGRGPDHSTAGALEAVAAYPGPIGRIVATIVAAHHAGLADGTDFETRLAKAGIPPYPCWRAAIGPLPAAAELSRAHLKRPSPERGFSEAFLIRMLFSCLVDADFLETEAFYARAEGREPGRTGFSDPAILRGRLARFMAEREGQADPTDLNRLRARIRAHVIARAPLYPGLFTLTVPTGGGKTLASLSFGLEHAVRHGLKRVVYVAPFTSIIEQTAEVFRAALTAEPGGRNETDILEHHATFDWDAARDGREDGRGGAPADRLRRAAENWAAPIVVTTAVQFFESLFANRTSRCRKLHHLAKSVIVLDEAQTMPLHLLRPCLAALDELARNYGASVVLCTATQPALRCQDGFARGLDIPDERELAPDPADLYERLRRVAVKRLPDPVPDETVAARFADRPQMLCIVNRRAHAQALYSCIRHLPGAVHLSTLMCTAHRRAVLAEAKRRLADGAPVRIVSTSLIEAGVDIDLPEVWRAAAGIDSIAQAAGRCNREGRLPDLGRLVVFEPTEGWAPPDLEQAWQAGRTVLRLRNDPLGLEAVRDYFGALYWQRGADMLDAATLDGERYPILDAIAARAPRRGETNPTLAFPFASIARAFRVVDEVMEPVIVPWQADPADRTAEEILARVAAMDRPLAGDLRRLRQYAVGVPRKVRADWLASGALTPVHRDLGDALLRFADLSHYDVETGVRLDEPTLRDAGSNIF